jgi:hypothetical protein
MTKTGERLEKIEEAIRVRPSPSAMILLREDLEAMEELAETHKERLSAGALRILIEMHDKLPPPKGG